MLGFLGVAICIMGLLLPKLLGPTLQEESARRKEIWERIGGLFSPPPQFQDDFGTYRPILQFADGRPVETPADWLERRKELLQQWHDLLGPWPPLLEKPHAREEFRETGEGFTRQQICLFFEYFLK